MTSWLKWAKILTRGLLSYSAEKLYQNPSPYNSTESTKNQFGKTRKKKIHLFSAICIWFFFYWECYRIWSTTRLINRRLRSSSSFITLNKIRKKSPHSISAYGTFFNFLLHVIKYNSCNNTIKWIQNQISVYDHICPSGLFSVCQVMMHEIILLI